MRRRCRARCPALAGFAMEGRAVARRFRRRETNRRPTLAHRPRWKRRRQIARAFRRTTVFLVCRGRDTGRRDVARELASARGGCGTITREIAVRDDKPPPLSSAAGSVWPLRNTWNRATEDLFSAWIEKLFDAPLDAAPSWTALHEVLRDRSRNFLFNHLGLGEDEMGIVIRPDCADLPYFLRAYFAFKMGLPFGYAKCSRGGGGQPPKCFQWFSVQNIEAARATSPDQKVATAVPTGRKDPALQLRLATICGRPPMRSTPDPRERQRMMKTPIIIPSR